MTPLEQYLTTYVCSAACVSLLGIVLAVVSRFTPGSWGPVFEEFFDPAKSGSRLREDSLVDLKTAELEAARFAEAASAAAAAVESSSSSAVDPQPSPSATPSARSLPVSGDEEYVISLLRRHTASDRQAFLTLLYTSLYFVLALWLLLTRPSFFSVLFMSGWVVRSFVIFHDACHLSFFKSPRANIRLAHVLSCFIPQNQGDWTASHNYHHLHLGDSSHSDFSLTVWFNVAEYESMPTLVRFAFRIIRDPLLLPGILSAWVFIIFPFIKSPSDTFPNRLSFYIPFTLLFGLNGSLLYLLSSWVGGMIGITLFHLQHQCNAPYRVSHDEFDLWDAGLRGSTHLLVPWPLDFVTLGIGK